MPLFLLVLYLYEFTLLSNGVPESTLYCHVLYLYEFTLLSNNDTSLVDEINVLYLYEFTLLSNNYLKRHFRDKSYTSMNLHYSQTSLVLKSRTKSLIPL